MKSKLLRTAALVSSLSIGVVLVFRASAGCGSSDAPAKVEAEGTSSGATNVPQKSSEPTEEGVFFPGSKAPGGTGTRKQHTAEKIEPSVSVPQEFFGGSKAAPPTLPRKQEPQPAPQQPAPQQQK